MDHRNDLDCKRPDSVAQEGRESVFRGPTSDIMDMDIMDIPSPKRVSFYGTHLRGDKDVTFQENDPNVASSIFKD